MGMVSMSLPAVCEKCRSKAGTKLRRFNLKYWKYERIPSFPEAGTLSPQPAFASVAGSRRNSGSASLPDQAFPARRLSLKVDHGHS
jgi:hypothetical protein